MAEELIITDKKDHPAARTIVTSIRVKKNPRHWHLTIWSRGGQAGQLVIDAADGDSFINMLIPPNKQLRREDP